VTNWNDTTTVIPYANQNGVPFDNDIPPNQLTQKFSDANISFVQTIGQAYSNVWLPITVVYQFDESGSTYILTNYLQAVCPLLDPTARISTLRSSAPRACRAPNSGT
jgi:hypothetical protein